MTTDLPNARGDLFIADFYPELGEYLAERHTSGYDAVAGRTRFTLWLATHTGDAADSDRSAVTKAARASGDRNEKGGAKHV